MTAEPDEPRETRTGYGPEEEGEGEADAAPADAGAPPPEAPSPTRGTPGLACELCGGPVLDRHCKIVCLNCGYQRDCSDP